MFGQDRERNGSPCSLELFTARLSRGRCGGGGRKTPTTTWKCFPWKGAARERQKRLTGDAELAAYPFRWILPPHPPTADTQPLSQWGLLVPASSQFSLASVSEPYPSGFPTLGLDSFDPKPTIRRPGRASLLLTSSTHLIPLLGLLHLARDPLPSLLTGK